MRTEKSLWKNMKRPVLSAVAFFGTLGILSVGYSAYVSSYPATATNGGTLSSGEWNKMVSALQTLDDNLSNLTFSGGNVGIGVPPSSKLDVNGSVRTGGNLLSSSITPGMWVNETDGSKSAFMVLDGNNLQFQRRGLNYGSYEAAPFYVRMDAPHASLNVDTLGNVGVNTGTPYSKLDVKGPSGVTSFAGTTPLGVTVQGSTSTNDYAGIDFRNTQGGSNPQARIGSYQTGGGSYLQFGTSNNYSAGITNTAMSIDPSGNVGVGVSAPATRLNAAGNIRNSAPSQWYLELSGDLPGYSVNTYPTLKTNFSYMYFSVGGAYSAYMTSGGALTAQSDKNKKENITPLDYQSILSKIDGLPITQWNYKSESDEIRHIGPFAQDFHAAFGLNGPDDRMISHIDPSGVALAGIKGLSEKVKAQQTIIDAQSEAIRKLEARLDELSAK